MPTMSVINLLLSFTFALAVLGVNVKRTVIQHGVITTSVRMSQVAWAEWTAVIVLHAPAAPPMRQWVAIVYEQLMRAQKFFTNEDLNYMLNRLMKLENSHDDPQLFLDTDRSAALSGRHLLNVVGLVGHSLFGLVTDGQVQSLTDELKVAESGVSVLPSQSGEAP